VSTLVAVVVVGLGSYLMRLLPLLTGGGRDVSARIDHVLDSGAMAAIVALVVDDVISSPTTTTRIATVVALVVAGGLAVKGRSMAVLIAAGTIVYTVLTRLG